MATEPSPSAPSSALQPLADVIAHGPEDQEPAPGFVASLHGENVEVTAVLKRTAVVASLRDRWADKQVVQLGDLLVHPAAIAWRPTALPSGFKRRLRYSPGQRDALRAASDRRARADQARRAAAEAADRQASAAQRATHATPPDAGAATSRPPATAARQRAITASAVAARASCQAPSKPQQPANRLVSELRRAQQRIVELEAELELHRAVAYDVVRRVEVAVGRRAA